MEHGHTFSLNMALPTATSIDQAVFPKFATMCFVQKKLHEMLEKVMFYVPYIHQIYNCILHINSIISLMNVLDGINLPKIGTSSD